MESSQLLHSGDFDAASKYGMIVVRGPTGNGRQISLMLIVIIFCKLPYISEEPNRENYSKVELFYKSGDFRNL